MVQKIVDAGAAKTKPSSATGLSKREAGKQERRKRIICAARDMIRETGSTGLSMRALAQRAGVSLATPYNLFGSRGAVILAVLDDIRDFQERFARFPSTDPLDRVFAVIDLSMDYYLADNQFYMTLWREALVAASDVRAAIDSSGRAIFWQKMICEIASAGVIRPGIDPLRLLRQLDYQFRSVLLDWVSGDLVPEALAPTVKYGYALILAGAASPEYRGRLDRAITDYQPGVPVQHPAAQRTSHAAS